MCGCLHAAAARLVVLNALGLTLALCCVFLSAEAASLPPHGSRQRCVKRQHIGYQPQQRRRKRPHGAVILPFLGQMGQLCPACRRAALKQQHGDCRWPASASCPRQAEIAHVPLCTLVRHRADPQQAADRQAEQQQKNGSHGHSATRAVFRHRVYAE